MTYPKLNRSVNLTNLLYHKKKSELLKKNLIYSNNQCFKLNKEKSATNTFSIIQKTHLFNLNLIKKLQKLLQIKIKSMKAKLTLIPDNLGLNLRLLNKRKNKNNMKKANLFMI